MVNLFSEAKISPRWKVNAEDLNRLLKNALIFISPAVLIYLLQVQGTLTLEGHTFSTVDFLPSTFTKGAIMSWFISTLIDVFRKFQDGK